MSLASPVDAPDTPRNDVVDVLVDVAVNGFDDGYFRATRDACAALIPAAESFLHERPDASPDLRRVAYELIERIQRELLRLHPSGSEWTDVDPAAPSEKLYKA